jgi:hypothetical protein
MSARAASTARTRIEHRFDAEAVVFPDGVRRA